MPTVTLTWQGPFLPQDVGNYNVGGIPAPWIKTVEWFSGGAGLGAESGVYIIENDLNRPVYAGRATSVLARFNNRSSSLHDLAVHANPALLNHRVWYARAAAVPAWYARISWVERWLVRFLYKRDKLQAGQQFQNRTLLAPFDPPAGGMRVQWATNLGATPAYMNEPTFPGYMGAAAPPNFVAYNHPVGAGQILP